MYTEYFYTTRTVYTIWYKHSFRTRACTCD